MASGRLQRLRGVEERDHFNDYFSTTIGGPNRLAKYGNRYLTSYAVQPEFLRSYYMAKGAMYVQVENKGLFHLSEEYALINPTTGKKTALFDFPGELAGHVRVSGGSENVYPLRGGLDSPIAKVRIISNQLSLDDPEDRVFFLSQHCSKKALSETQGQSHASLLRNRYGRY